MKRPMSIQNMKQTKRTKLFHVLSGLFILMMFLYVFYMQMNLPNLVPIHLSKGEIDGMGSPKWFFIIPFIATILFIGLLYISRNSHLCNYLIEITEKNRNEMYRLMSEAIACLNLAIVLGFSITIWEAIEMAKNEYSKMEFGFTILIIVPLAILDYYSLLMWHKNWEINKGID